MLDPNTSRILFLSTYDKDGGAAACFMGYALALREAGCEVAMVVKYKTTDYSWVYPIAPAYSTSNRLVRFCQKHFCKTKRDISREQQGDYVFFYQENEFSVLPPIERIISVLPWNPTLIFSSMTCELANTTSLLTLSKSFHAPIYFDAYDMNVFTGGCHVLWGCDGFKNRCSKCPAFASKPERQQEVEKSFAIKVKNIHDGGMGILYAGPYLLALANESACYKDMPKFDIGMCIDTDLFTNKNRDIAKRIIGLPEDAIVIFTGSENVVNKRKGVQYFFDALSVLWNALPESQRPKVYVMLAGKNVEKTQEKLKKLPPFHYHCIPYISDNRLLSLAYQASDMFVCPSIDDAGPMMVAEALACGTPVVGFKMGLMYEPWYVKDGETGYVVELKDVEQLAQAMKKIILLHNNQFQQMSLQCRNVAEQSLSKTFSISQIINIR